MRLAVLGAGAWGTALAISFSLSQRHTVSLWARDPALVLTISAERMNQRYLPGIKIPPSIMLESDIAATLRNADLTLIATSTAGLATTTALIPSLAAPGN